MSIAQAIRETTGVPTAAIGLITDPKQAEAILAEGKADLVALARGMLFDPRWPWHAAAQLGAASPHHRSICGPHHMGISNLFAATASLAR